MKKILPLLILLIMALATRFTFLNYPAEVVFDEVHFGKFVSAYSTHQYYFDIHPPLGKLMIAGFAGLFGFDPTIGFEKIGEAVNASTLFILRFLPALFGSFLPLIIYGIVLALAGSKKAAFLAGSLIVFDNAFLVESKFILVDSFLLFFGFLSIFVFLASRKQENRFRKYLFYFASMALAGLAFSIKWTGLSFLGIIFLFSFVSFLQNVNLKRFLKFSAEVIASLALFAFVYTLPFVIHFQILNLSGPGDAFMSQSFQKTLNGNVFAKEAFWEKFKELNQKMYFYNSGLTKGHQDSSQWHEWLFDRKPVWYWSETIDGKAGNIYFMGNPLIWGSALFAVILGFALLFKLKVLSPSQGLRIFNASEGEKKDRWKIFFLLSGYFANLLPFIFVSRTAFLYHYLAALVFAVMLLAILADKFLISFKQYFIFLGVIILAFLMLSPISYGFLLNQKIANGFQLLAQFFH